MSESLIKNAGLAQRFECGWLICSTLYFNNIIMEKDFRPKEKGINTELHCLAAFSDYGFLISVPYGDNGRYDMIVDTGTDLYKVQIKTASPYYNSKNEFVGIRFQARSGRVKTEESYTRKYTKEEIDYFATYWNGNIYVVPVEEASSNKVLRFFWPENSQIEQANFVEDYTIEKQWNKNKKYADNIIPLKAVKHICKRCGAPTSCADSYCSECASFLARYTEWPDRDNLKDLIRTLPFTQIGEKFGVTNNAVRKWCDKYHLPRTKKEIKEYTDKEWEAI